MKTVRYLAAALLTAGLSFNAFAADKVAVFNMQAAIMQTESAQQALKNLDENAEFSALRAKFESLRADLVSMQKDFQTNSMTWNDEQKLDYRKKVEYKQADLKLAGEKLKAEQNVVVQQIMQMHAKNAETALKQVVTAEGVSLVLDSKAAYYAEESADITLKVTDRLNKLK